MIKLLKLISGIILFSIGFDYMIDWTVTILTIMNNLFIISLLLLIYSIFCYTIETGLVTGSIYKIKYQLLKENNTEGLQKKISSGKKLNYFPHKKLCLTSGTFFFILSTIFAFYL